MPRRYLSVAVFSIILGLIAWGGYLYKTPSPKKPVRILFENAGGNVVFSHGKHIRDYNTSCTECHHTGTYTPCGKCHGIVFDKAFRTSHVADMPDAADCVACHHMGNNFEDNRELWKSGAAIDVSTFQGNCADCHTPKELQQLVPDRMNAYHSTCIPCHEKRGKGPRTKDQCKQCHTN